MGRIDMRQSAVFPFQGRKLRVYRPTDGQLLAIGVAGKRDPGESMARLWRVLEKLFVSSADWAWFDDRLVGGESTVKEITDWAGSLIGHKWPDFEPEPEPEDAPPPPDMHYGEELPPPPVDLHPGV